MLAATPETAVLSKQRELLEFLDEITVLQEQALDSGDLLALTRLSDQRAQVVGEAAHFVPPAMAWAPETTQLALHVRDRSEELQRAVRACMDKVQKELVALTHRQHVTSYLNAQGARPGARWQV